MLLSLLFSKRRFMKHELGCISLELSEQIREWPSRKDYVLLDDPSMIPVLQVRVGNGNVGDPNLILVLLFRLAEGYVVRVLVCRFVHLQIQFLWSWCEPDLVFLQTTKIMGLWLYRRNRKLYTIQWSLSSIGTSDSHRLPLFFLLPCDE